MSPAYRLRSVDELWGFCRGCYYADVCRGGCTWTADSLFGRPGNNPYCHHRALEMAREGKRESVVRVAEAPGQPFDYGLFEIVVEEGQPTVNGRLTVDGMSGVPAATQTALQTAARLALPAGAAFDEGQGDKCEKAARKALRLSKPS